MKLVIYCFLAVLVFGWMICNRAQSQDGHMRYHHYYQNWKQPGTWPAVSCCNARIIDANGKDLMGDCEPTRGEVRNGKWFFWLRQESRWIEIPDDRIIRERNPSSEEAHLCARLYEGKWVILCAVPPDLGG